MRRTSLLQELKACRNIEKGRSIHKAITQSGHDSSVHIASTLMQMYARCGGLEDAHFVFDKMQYRDVVAWTVLIMGYADNGKGEMALDLFSKMRGEGCAADSRTFVAALKSCSGLDKQRGRTLHLLASRSGYDSDLFVGNTLVDMYAKHENIEQALTVFERMPVRDVVSWNAIIFGYVENGQGEVSLGLFSRMRNEGYCAPDSRTFVATVKACSELSGESDSSRLSGMAKTLQMLALRSGCASDVYVEGALVDLFLKYGSIEDARITFEGMQYKDLVPWNTLILGYADNAQGEMSLELLPRMWHEGFAPDARTLVGALKACSSLADFDKLASLAKLHILTLKLGCDSDHFVANTLVDVYAKCGLMDVALSIFMKMPYCDLIAWNALILGYAEYGDDSMALDSFIRMKSAGCAPDSRSFVAALKACSELEVGKALHLLALRSSCSNMYLECSLVDMYANCGGVENARAVFEGMQQRNVVSWNAMIWGYADNEEGDTALDLFERMRDEGFEPDVRTFVGVLKACGNGVLLEAAHLLAARCGCDSYIYVGSTLVDMYSKCGCMEAARMVFDTMKVPDVSSWTALILGYAENGEPEMSLNLLSKMAREGCAPEARTLVAALKACADLAVKEDHKIRSTERGKALHLLASRSNASDTNIYVNSSLVDMYLKVGLMEDAQSVFDHVCEPDVISWNVLLTGYADNGEGAIVLELLERMKDQGLEPNVVTYAAVLKACGILGALDLGRNVHDEICSLGLQRLAVTPLVDFYCKCGSLLEAKQAFDLHGTGDLMSWNALLAGYSRHGDTENVFALFDSMPDAGVQPNAVTLLCVLTACSHAGCVDKGKSYFETMSTKYGVPHEIEHYACMVDILGRGKQLEEAMVLLRSMPFTPNILMWMTVLGACRKWKNVELGKLSFASLTSLDDKNVAAYVLMANLYGSKGLWKEQAEVQSSRAKLGVGKKPGQSWWTNQTGVVNKFMAGDKSHLQTREIHEKLRDIVVRLKEHGYVADLSSVTWNISDDEKENALCGHSERLAIACALINTNEGETIRIIKNLRVCDDCHVVTALISKMERRTILCRDASRFHLFQGGKCSCGDFW